MIKNDKDFKEEIERILQHERWQGYTTGLIEGALNVIFRLDLEREKRVELLANAAGLGMTTAQEFVDGKERELSENAI